MRVPKMGVRSLWNGEVALSKAFWLYGVFGVAVSLPVLGMTQYVMDFHGLSIGSCLFTLLILGYQWIAAIGIWRSATRYFEMSPLAIIARFSALLCVAALSVTVIGHWFDLFNYERKASSELAGLRSLAERGNAYAEYEFGRRYQFGLGVEENQEEALKWFRKSAEQGDADGEFCLGYLFSEGLGGIAPNPPEAAINPTEAIKWNLKSAEQDNAFAEYALGRAYERGSGVTKDLTNAYMWFLLAEQHPYFAHEIKAAHISERLAQSQIADAKRMVATWRARHALNNNSKGCSSG